jgi:hypothetical protein
MKLIRHAFALAVTPENHDVTTTGDLVELCGVNVDDSLYEAAMGFCLGYIDVAMDYHAALTAGPKYDTLSSPDYCGRITWNVQGVSAASRGG